jgi:hypothetical protein
MTSVLIKKTGWGPESIFSCQGGLRGKKFENHCIKGLTNADIALKRLMEGRDWLTCEWLLPHGTIDIDLVN